MQRQQVLVWVVAAAALLSFGVAADGLGTDPPPVGQTPEQTGRGESLPTLPELWEFPGCDPCRVDTRPLVESAADAVPPVVFAGLAVLGALALVGAYFSAGGGDESPTPPPTENGATEAVSPTQGTEPATPAAPAPPPANDVYRAWRALARRVDAGGHRGRALTPREYADAAREQGFDDDAVELLTRLFRRVRYGGAEPTADRERRARRARDALDGQGKGDAGTASVDGVDAGDTSAEGGEP